VSATKITNAPAAFSAIAGAINNHADLIKPLKAGKGIQIAQDGEKVLVSSFISQADINNLILPQISYPFKVFLEDEATPKANIIAESRAYTSLGTSATSITNLTTAFTLASNTYVWIQFTVSSLAVTAISRQTGTAWPSLVVTSGSPAAQTQFNVPVGKVTASKPTAPGFEFSISGTNYHFEQCLFSHLLVSGICNSGTPALYAFPFSGG
jgi:hypothetical protein